MSIIKLSTNSSVTVKNKYTVVASKLVKTAEELKMEATKNNLMMNCIKKITANGENS